jgi:hypothetical protein
VSSQLPSVVLPKGGGAIRGIGEKFAATPTGTGSMSVPIVTSLGRSGFGPELALQYDSRAGNGPFGFGWHLSTPSITRKTDKGLPQYDDARDSDVYLISNAEDLVPMFDQDGQRFADEVAAPGFVIHPYRPRISRRDACGVRQRARRHGSPGKYGSDGNVESVTYRAHRT